MFVETRIRIHEVSSVDELVRRLTGEQIVLGTVYGFAISRGADVKFCCGLTLSGKRLAEYLPAVSRGGGQQHPLWKNVPGRLRRFFAQGFRYDAAKGVCILKNVPRGAENACAFALLEAVGIESGTDVGERVSGGLLALDQTIAGVSDACLLHHWHNTGACCGCGSRDHLIQPCTVQNEGLPGIRALRENLAVAEDALRTARAAAQDAENALHSAQDRAHAAQDAVSDGSHVEVEAVPPPPHVEAPPQPLSADVPILPVVPKRRLRFKQRSRQYGQQVETGNQMRWKRVQGVSLTAQSNLSRGSHRLSFQVNLHNMVPSKLYFRFNRWTSPDTQPCNSQTCWRKADGKALDFCGRDICAYDAAITCRAELLSARPDGRKRSRGCREGLADPGTVGEALQAWKRRWVMRT